MDEPDDAQPELFGKKTRMANAGAFKTLLGGKWTQ